MGHNPLIGTQSAAISKKSAWAAFVHLDNLLKNLTIPEVEGTPLTQIVKLPGWEIDKDGVLTPASNANDRYALLCTATPGAPGVASAGYPVGDTSYLDILMHLRFANFSGEKVLLHIKNQTGATRIAFGLNANHNLYLQFGATAYESMTDFSTYLYPALINQWLDVGVSINMDYTPAVVHFWVYGIASSTIEHPIAAIPASTADQIELGCAGVEIADCAMVANSTWQLCDPNGKHTPLPIHRPPYSGHYYDFKPGDIAITIPDRSADVLFKTDLTLQTGATVNVVEMF